MLEHETGFVFGELLTFALLVFLLRSLAWKHLIVALSDHEKEMRSQLQNALDNREKAEETLRLARTAVADQDKLVAAILGEAARRWNYLRLSRRSCGKDQDG